MKALAIAHEGMHKAAARAAIVILVALAAGCGQEPASSQAAGSAADSTACDNRAARSNCAPRGTRSTPVGPRTGAPVYEVYANSNGAVRNVPELEVAAVEPPSNELSKMSVEVDVKLDPVAVVPEPVRNGR